ncbi:CrcB family protein [Anaerobacillus sp. 1_MG-2023]|uniref:fluoride efflux transporter FluC n=1 Tax=Anaerobacillus sp. 1_MG-2023 TaxID=3062655 RepID=UPI0026E4599C|nr:CrcB family protein [Anaerobacillus sp. 1_MG-2023]MDO6656157.1 CrcB family protein [Anaerobacillus sp. 1_MG-2023]
MKNSFAVVLGGAIGATLRAVVGTILNGSPLSTFIVNIVGSIILGFFYQYNHSNNRFSEPAKKMIVTGMIGSFTTFSTYSLDLLVYIKDGQFIKMGLYGGGTIVSGILSVFLGVLLAKRTRKVT